VPITTKDVGSNTVHDEVTRKMWVQTQFMTRWQGVLDTTISAYHH